jgi:spore maturation protein CgeB
VGVVVSHPIEATVCVLPRAAHRAVLAVVTRALTGDVIHRAGQRRCDAETGVVTFIQRFGSALNLNIHLHMLVPDGVWRFVNGKAHFHRTPGPDDAHIERLLARLIRRIIRCLVRAGVLVMEAEQPYLDVDTAADDGLAGLAGAAVRYRIAVGPLAGQRTMRLRVPTLTESLLPNPGALTADHEGFSLNAAVACGAHERDKLERLCRYMARGPIAQDRLSVDRNENGEQFHRASFRKLRSRAPARRFILQRTHRSFFQMPVQPRNMQNQRALQLHINLSLKRLQALPSTALQMSNKRKFSACVYYIAASRSRVTKAANVPRDINILLVAKPWRGGLADYLHKALHSMQLGEVHWWPSYPDCRSEKRKYARDKARWRRELCQRIDAGQHDVVLCLNPLAEFSELSPNDKFIAWLTDDPRHDPALLAPFGQVFISDPGYADEMDEALQGQFSGVIPFAYCPLTHVPVAAAERGGLCMIGNRDDKRSQHLQALASARALPTIYGNYFLKDRLFWRKPSHFRPSISNAQMRAIYARYDASLNIHAQVVRGGTNMRTFECAAYGIAQIVEARPCLEDLFALDQEIITYTDANDIVEVVGSVLSDPVRAAAIAKRAQARVLDRHTYAHRIASMLRDLVPANRIQQWL